MSILDDLFATDSIRLDPVGLDVVEPPRFAGVPVIPPGPRRESVACIAKRRGTLDGTLTVLGIAISFRGTFLGIDGRGRWLLRWSTDDRTPQPFMMTTIRRIQGNATVEIQPLEPLRTDLTTCDGSAGEYFVTLSMVASDDLEERFRGVPNQIRVEADWVTPTRALFTDMRGTAGAAAPPPTPWPQPMWVTLSTSCVPSARSTRSVFGQVRLDRPVLRSHARFECVVTAEGVDPRRALDTRVGGPIGASVGFEVLLPPDLIGTVRVTALTNDRSRARSADFTVGGGQLGLGCGGPIEAEYYEPIRVGCKAYDCGWTGMNDLSELIGRSGGEAVRYLTSRRIIDPVERRVGAGAILRAINNRGGVVGFVELGDGQVEGFVYRALDADPGGPPELYRVPGVRFHALNDAGVAVGSRHDDQKTVPIRWAKGEIEELAVPAANAIALAIDGAGHFAGVHVPGDDEPARAFVWDEQGFQDLGALWGSVVSLVMNGAGSVAGTVMAKERFRGFAYSQATGMLDLKAPGGTGQAVVAGINNAGVVVGTFWSGSNGPRRAFRFTMGHGSEGLSTLVPADRHVQVEAAVAINNVGQILVLGTEKGVRGNFVLHPSSIPPPQLPIP